MFVRSAVFASCLASLLFLSACASAPVRSSSAKSPAPRVEPVWLVSNRFHTSIAVEADDAPPQVRAFDPRARFFVIGWGGRDLYMMQRVMPWQWITSTILPTASALHVIPIRAALEEECANSEIIEFAISERGRDRLREHLRRAFARDKEGKVLVVGPGKTEISRFYAGTETYYLPKTCNLWVASALRTAGVPIQVSRAFFAGNLLAQGQKHGTVIRTFRHPADAL